mgnify:CR=1 FL=1
MAPDGRAAVATRSAGTVREKPRRERRLGVPARCGQWTSKTPSPRGFKRKHFSVLVDIGRLLDRSSICGKNTASLKITVSRRSRGWQLTVGQLAAYRAQ